MAKKKGKTSVSKSKVKVLPEAAKRMENNLGYNALGGKPKAYWGATS